MAHSTDNICMAHVRIALFLLALSVLSAAGVTLRGQQIVTGDKTGGSSGDGKGGPRPAVAALWNQFGGGGAWGASNFLQPILHTIHFHLSSDNGRHGATGDWPSVIRTVATL